jgi:hypothetical protein
MRAGSDRLAFGPMLVYALVVVAVAGCTAGPAGNQPPSIAAVADQRAARGYSLDVPFTVSDEAPATVTVTATSGSTDVLPDTALDIVGSGASRTLRIDTGGDATGTTSIELTARDEDGLEGTTAFALTIAPAFERGHTKLTATPADAGDYFGNALAADGTRLLVGARGSDEFAPSAGAVFAFELLAGEWLPVQSLGAEDAATGASFGHAVAIDGDRAIVGAPDADHGGQPTGAAYVFERVGGAWTQVVRVTASDAAPGAYFGWSVGLHGDRAVVGAMADDEAGADAGAVYVFRKDGDTWAEIGKIIDEVTVAGDAFGWSVAGRLTSVSVPRWPPDDAGRGTSRDRGPRTSRRDRVGRVPERGGLRPPRRRRASRRGRPRPGPRTSPSTRFGASR